MNPQLPYFSNMKNKLAIDHTVHLLCNLEYLVQTFDPQELIARLAIMNVLEYEINRRKLDIFTEVPGLQLIIDLCLRNENKSDIIPTEENLLQTLESLEHFFKSLRDYIHSDIDEQKEFDYTLLISSIRMQSMLLSINRERYWKQQEEHIHGIYLKLDERFKKEFGFTLTEALDFSKKLWNDFTEKIKTKNLKALEKTLNPLGNPDFKLEKISKKTQIDINDYVKNLFIAYSNPKELFSHSISEFCNKNNFDLLKFSNYLKLFSVKFGDVKKNPMMPFGEFFINYKPVISSSGDTIFCPIHDILFYNFHIIIDKIVREYKGEKSKIFQSLKDKKKNYIEGKVFSYLTRLFPTICIHKNIFYNFEDKFAEVDLLVIFDNKILIIEAKGGELNPSAKHGEETALKDHLKKNIEKAFKQSSNCKRFLENTETPTFEDANHNVLFKINRVSEMKIFQINVTLEPLGRITGILGKLNVLGLFENGEYPWSVYLYDLDIITHILQYPSLFLNYIEQRTAVQRDSVFLPIEEKQLFYWYLNFLNLQPFDFPNQGGSFKVLISDPEAFTIFDDYYVNKGKKPRINVDKKTLKLILKQEQKRIFRYSDTVTEILNEYEKNVTPFRKK